MFSSHEYDSLRRAGPCGIQVRVAESEVKYPTPTPTFSKSRTRDFPKFSTPDSDSLRQREWNLSYKINGDRGAQQEICFNKFQKNLYYCNRNS